MKRPVRSDDALAITVGLALVPALERAARIELAVDSVLFHAERDRAALIASRPAPTPITTSTPARARSGVVITRVVGWTAIAVGLVVGLSDPTLSGQRLLALIIITAGGALLARLMQVTQR